MKYMKNIQVWTESEVTGLKNISFIKTAGCRSSTENGGDMRHTESVHKEKHTKNNYSAANTAYNPLKPHKADQSEHSSVVLTLFCHTALLALPAAAPPLSSVAQSQPGDDTDKLTDNFKYSISTSLSL